MAEFDVAAKLETYRAELGAQIEAIGERSPFEDYRQPYLAEAAVSNDDAFPAALAPRLASLIQGRAEPLALIAAETRAELGEGAPALDVVLAKIRLVAERKAYGVAPKKAVVVTDDDSRLHAWCWEVSAPEAFFPPESVKIIKAARQERGRAGKFVKTTAKLVDVLIKGDAAKAQAEEEKVLKVKRDAEALRLKAEVAQRKRDEAAAKKEATALKKQEAAAAKAAKAAKPASPKKPAGKPKVSNASKSVMAGFLSKAPKRDSTESRKKAPPPPPAKVETARTLSLLEALEAARAAPPALEALRAELRGRPRPVTVEAEVQLIEPRRGFFAFHSDFGPPRTAVQTSAVVTATNPFARDPAVDYDYDSDAERYANEGLVEDGEDLSDGEDLEDEDDGELDNEDGFFCGEDDDEGGPARRAGVEREVATVSPLKPGEEEDAERAAALAPFAPVVFFDPSVPLPAEHAEPVARKRASAAKPATPEDAPAAKKKKASLSTGQKTMTGFFGAKK
jgi:hypothetical protein